MKSSFKLPVSQIQANLQAVQKLLQLEGIDACYISSFDPYLNEYVPLEDCHRYYLTGFTGSTAECLLPAQGRIKLYVDGRYHEQADLEVDASLVEVVKGARPNTVEILETIKREGYQKVGLEGNRTALEFFKRLESACDFAVFGHQIQDLLKKPTPGELRPIELVPASHRGDGTLIKLQKIFGAKKDEAHYVTALDTIAWLTNCRGYHLPFLSSFLARALVTHDRVHIFVADEIQIKETAKNEPGLHFIHCSADAITHQLTQLQKQYQLTLVNYDPTMLSYADFRMLEHVFSASHIRATPGGLIDFQAIKEPGEIREFISSFEKASKAIFNTIQWVKQNVAAGSKISEFGLYQQTSTEYARQGAITQSFNTISGVGANGSIIHYSDVKKDRIIAHDDMVLLDSGGYFEGGFATDTTRTFMAGSKDVKPEYKRMYTLVLKGFIGCHSAVFPEGTSGGALDGLARMPLFKQGLNYNHGTGHGVGIHVHEGGAGISHARATRMKEGQVVSVEPGYYVPGLGGVRIENVAVVEKHPTYKGFLYLKPLTLVGLEPSLIDLSLLTHEEQAWLTDYEEKCRALGTSWV